MSMPRGKARAVLIKSAVTAATLLGSSVAAKTASAATPVPTIVHCGDSIDHSVRFLNSLFDCVGNGLTVAADNVTIDLGGMRIDGNDIDEGMGGPDVGVAIWEHTGVRLVNGTISDFMNGVSVDGGGGIRVEKITALSNPYDGIHIERSDSPVLRSNTILNSGDAGILVASGSGATIRSNTVSGNAGNGISLLSAAHVVVKGNTISANGDDAPEGRGNGIYLEGGSGHYLEHNTVTGNGWSGYAGILVVGGTSHTTRANTVLGNNYWGILVESGTGHIVKNNSASGNGFHGIRVDSGDKITVAGNKTYQNGFYNGGDDNLGLGVSVSASVTNFTASGNSSMGNDDGSECSPNAGCMTGPAPTAVIVHCGDHVDESIEVANSLFGCVRHGLVVANNDITVDLNRMRIDGNGINNGGDTVDTGVLNENGYSGVRVTNGTVSDFEEGVYARFGGNHAVIDRITTLTNTDVGIWLDDTPNARVSNNIAAANTWDGVTISGSGAAGCIARANSAVGNGHDGLYLKGGGGNLAVANAATANRSVGIELDTAGTTGNVAKYNHSSGNDDGFSVRGANNMVKANIASGNLLAGIHVEGTGQVIKYNTATGNTGDGISLGSGDADHVSSNHANFNGFQNGLDDNIGTGIVVQPGVTGVTAGDNAAKGNDDPSECSIEAGCN